MSNSGCGLVFKGVQRWAWTCLQREPALQPSHAQRKQKTSRRARCTTENSSTTRQASNATSSTTAPAVRATECIHGCRGSGTLPRRRSDDEDQRRLCPCSEARISGRLQKPCACQTRTQKHASNSRRMPEAAKPYKQRWPPVNYHDAKRCQVRKQPKTMLALITQCWKMPTNFMTYIFVGSQ